MYFFWCVKKIKFSNCILVKFVPNSMSATKFKKSSYLMGSPAISTVVFFTFIVATIGDTLSSKNLFAAAILVASETAIPPFLWLGPHGFHG